MIDEDEVEGISIFTFDACKDGHPDDHWFRTPLCQKLVTTDWDPSEHVCGGDLFVFEHNDIVNEEEMHRKHELVPAVALTDETTRRANHCPGYIDHSWEPDRDSERCSCRCHWGQFYVNTYEVDRQWGGPEEGGWWYDSGEPVASVPFDTLREAEAFQTTMQARFPHDHSSNSVIYSGGDYATFIERGFARSYPERRPHYE